MIVLTTFKSWCSSSISSQALFPLLAVLPLNSTCKENNSGGENHNLVHFLFFISLTLVLFFLQCAIHWPLKATHTLSKQLDNQEQIITARRKIPGCILKWIWQLPDGRDINAHLYLGSFLIWKWDSFLGFRIICSLKTWLEFGSNLQMLIASAKAFWRRGKKQKAC